MSQHQVVDQRRKHWFWLHNVIIDEHAAAMGPIPLAVYVYLCRRANANGESWPARGTIAEHLGVSQRSVDNAVKVLRERRLIDVTPRWSDEGDRTSNLYIVLDPHISASMGSPSNEFPYSAPDAPPVAQDVREGSAPDAPPPASLRDVAQDVRHPWSLWDRVIVLLHLQFPDLGRFDAYLNGDTLTLAGPPGMVEMAATQWHKRVMRAVEKVAGRPLAVVVEAR